MRVLALFILLHALLPVNAQKIAIPKNLSPDSAVLANELPVIAKEVTRLYRENDKSTYFDNLFRCQLAAKEYAASIATIDSILEMNKASKWEGTPVIGIQFRCFALTKLSQLNSEKPFDELFLDNLLKLYERLPEKSKPYMNSFFDADPVTMKKNLDEMIKNAANKDSLLVDEARNLVRLYNSWNVYSRIIIPGKKFLVFEDNKKYEITDSVLITAKDGGKLSAIIVRNRSVTSPLPVVMMYNIYAGDYDKSLAKTAATKGYVGVVVNTRGKKLSPGIVEPFEHDGSDAYDVIEWISKQPWCNGSIGMYGGSYLGFSQWSATKKLHPALKTIVPQVAVGIGIDYPMHNNVFMSYMLQWIHYVVNNKLTDRTEFSNSQKWDSLYAEWYRSGRSFRALDTMENRPNHIFQRWLDHPSYDGYWQNMVPYAKEFSTINIPILTTTGFYDDDQRGAFFYFDQLHTWNPKANQYLLIGPYDHGGAQSSASATLRKYTIDSVANININETVFKWFDHILKDSTMPPMLKDRINYQVMGTNSWRSAPSIKAISKDTLTFYISNVVNKRGYKLVSKQPSPSNYIAQEIDYLDKSKPDHKDQNILDTVIQNDGRLVFVSDPLENNIIMTGSFQAMIAATLNKKDIDIAIDLYELQADGKYFFLSNFLGRASYAKDRSRRQLLQPGRQEFIPVRNSYFVSKQLSKGSRIVMMLGINNNSYWQVNYGSGKDVSNETIKDGAIPLEIKWSSKSYLKLPIE